ncbi:hypothetical protein AB0F91_46080 [Amycolatopsis sp. NPDC023774]|uniref:hypothetical protein n=1 Tax=Amycolatopsis sp. NPDC023774 TaxID=3155015 RepID=UPI00340C1391
MLPVNGYSHAVVASGPLGEQTAGLSAEVYLEMKSLQHQEEVFGVVSTRHFGVQTSVALP